MEVGTIEGRALAAACAVAAEQGVPCEQAEVINAGSNVLVHLRPSPVVARVMSGTVVLHEDPELWLTREVSVLNFLAPFGLAVPPSPLIAPGPYRSDGMWMTFCAWVELEGQSGIDDAELLGGALRELHESLAAYPGELGGFVELRERIERLRRQLRTSAELSAEQIESLGERLFGLDETVFEASLPTQPLHGDTSLSNLLRSSSGRLVWNDFEDVLRGPVHWDLAGFLISLEWRGADAAFVARVLDAYGGFERRQLEPFDAAHAVYDEIWGLYDAQRRQMII